MSALDVADALGVTPSMVHEQGTDGVVMMLEDGRVLKVTTSVNEAVLAMALMGVPEDGRPGGVPRVDSVHVCRPDELCGYPSRAFAILREDMADLPVASQGRWRRALHLVDMGIRNSDGLALRTGIDHWPGREMDDLVEGLHWFRSNLGVVLMDIQADNVGVTATGGVGMRDLGRSIVPEPMLDMLDDIPFLEDLPAFSPWASC